MWKSGEGDNSLYDDVLEEKTDVEQHGRTREGEDWAGAGRLPPTRVWSRLGRGSGAWSTPTHSPKQEASMH